jgi:subtilisin
VSVQWKVLAKIDGIDDPMNVGVAILDTGIDIDHPDLNVVGGVDCVRSDASTHTWDDQDGHGTGVAGIVGARDNAIGVVGVAPGVKLYAVRAFGKGDSRPIPQQSDSVVCGLNWVAANSDKIDVANLSLGFEYNTSDEADDDACGQTGLPPGQRFT